MISISHSRVQCYLSCPYSHYLRYIEKITKKGRNRPLSFGSDFHKLLEVRKDKKRVKHEFSKIKENYYDLDSESQSNLGDNYLQDLKEIFVDYMKIYKDTVFPYETEVQFEIPTRTKFNNKQIIFKGVIDEIYDTEDGILIGEHKTYNRKPDLITITMNTQKCLYAKAIEFMTGKLPVSIIWDYVKSSPAQRPVWLEKSGRFSESKSNNITEFSWIRACKEKGIKDPKILSKGKDLYEGNIHNFFFRYNEDYIKEMVDDIYNGFEYMSIEIAKNGDINKTKHTGNGCSWCEYRDICYAELTGGNVEYVKSKDYEERQ